MKAHNRTGIILNGYCDPRTPIQEALVININIDDFPQFFNFRNILKVKFEWFSKNSKNIWLILLNTTVDYCKALKKKEQGLFGHVLTALTEIFPEIMKPCPLSVSIIIFLSEIKPQYCIFVTGQNWSTAKVYQIFFVRPLSYLDRTFK